eukprot:gene16484-22708_t
MAIIRDTSLTEVEKAKKRQELMMGSYKPAEAVDTGKGQGKGKGKEAVEDEEEGSLSEHLKCAICMNLCDRPVTAPCQHNFCLGCFSKWTQQSNKKTCPTCPAIDLKHIANEARPDGAFITDQSRANACSGPATDHKHIANEARPNKAFITEQAIKTGRANACSDPAIDHKRIANEARPNKAFITERAIKNGRANACSGPAIDHKRIANEARPNKAFITEQAIKTGPAVDHKRIANEARPDEALFTERTIKTGRANACSGPAVDHKRIANEARPDEAFVTERAIKTGRANACSGKIFVTIPNDYFGPIGPEHDPTRNKGVQVGDFWKDRLDCRQWGAHFPHVAGIAGQSSVGAQSVVLSGGYEDDLDEGEWFLYTGSGGRDLSGNKRTSKTQSFDQVFEHYNKALMMSCTRGLPVRVVRSYKRSAYAPTDQTPVRYDGLYRILRCWRKPGNQKHLMCRYLFVRCDNAPAPWTTSDDGDSVRLQIPKEAAAEIKLAAGKVFSMPDKPYWDYLPEEKCWGWAKPPPESQQTGGGTQGSAGPAKMLKKRLSEREKALNGFSCGSCHLTLVEPVTTPCGHSFCKGCLEKKFLGITDVVQPNAARPSLRVRRNQKPCPTCKTDICDFLSNARVNYEMGSVIEKLKAEVMKAREEEARLAKEGTEGEGSEKEDAEEVEMEEGEEEAEDDQDEEEAEAKPPASKRAKVGGSSKAAEVEKTTDDGAGCNAEDEASDAAEAKPTTDGSGKDLLSSPHLAISGMALVVQATVHWSALGVQGHIWMHLLGLAHIASDASADTAEADDGAGGSGSGVGGGASAAPIELKATTSRFPKQFADLCAEFPEFDASLVEDMIEDQGGDEQDVRVMLSKFRTQAKRQDVRVTLSKFRTQAKSAESPKKAKKAATAPKKKATPPKKKTASPKKKAASPKEEATSPKTEATLPEEEAASPKEEAAHPKEEAASPKKEAALPKKKATKRHCGHWTPSTVGTSHHVHWSHRVRHGGNWSQQTLGTGHCGKQTLWALDGENDMVEAGHIGLWALGIVGTRDYGHWTMSTRHGGNWSQHTLGAVRTRHIEHWTLGKVETRDYRHWTMSTRHGGNWSHRALGIVGTRLCGNQALWALNNESKTWWKLVTAGTRHCCCWTLREDMVEAGHSRHWALWELSTECTSHREQGMVEAGHSGH